MWIGIIIMGRLIGFTTTRAATLAPPPAGVNFDDFLQGTPDKPGGTPTAPIDRK
jgi:hypothetical protein